MFQRIGLGVTFPFHPVDQNTHPFVKLILSKSSPLIGLNFQTFIKNLTLITVVFNEGDVAQNVCQVEGGATDESGDNENLFEFHFVEGTGVKIDT